MKVLASLLVGLLVLIQYPLWLGKGGWLRVWELDRLWQAQLSTNKRLAARNASLEGEVRDLRDGLYAVEERARYDLGMVRPDEIFIQFNETSTRHRLEPAHSKSAPVKAAHAGDAGQVAVGPRVETLAVADSSHDR